MFTTLAAGLVARLTFTANRLGARLGDERGQGTVEYAGLAMAIGVLLLAVGSYLGGKDHGIGAVVTDAVKSAIKHAVGTAK
jgi:Flp pilus assembly pilin Flp